MRYFWLSPPDGNSSREVDPLGFGSVHDVAASVLLPMVTGRTRAAEDYLWVVIGLHAASKVARTDAEVWAFFERFEKALKVYWSESGQRQNGFSGIRAVKRAVESRVRHFDFKLLSNQRSLGILGVYLSSLRGAGLAAPASLRLTERGRELAARVRANWGADFTGKWRHQFRRATETLKGPIGKQMLKDLGHLLFDDERMRSCAISIKKLGKKAHWRKAAKSLPHPPQRAIATAGPSLNELFKVASRVFWSLIGNPDAQIKRLSIGPLRQGGWLEAILGKDAGSHPLATFIERVAVGGRSARRALIELHEATWHRRGHRDLWIWQQGDQVRVRQDVRFKTPPADREWEMNWHTCYSLIKQTHWNPGL